MNSDSNNNIGKTRITTALLLAAGTGSRLFPITENSPKCLTLVSDKSILERGEGVVGSKRKADEIGVIIDAWGTCGNV